MTAVPNHPYPTGMPRLTPLIPTRVRRLYRKVFPHKPPNYAALWREACQKWIVGGTDLPGGFSQMNITRAG